MNDLWDALIDTAAKAHTKRTGHRDITQARNGLCCNQCRRQGHIHAATVRLSVFDPEQVVGNTVVQARTQVLKAEEF